MWIHLIIRYTDDAPHSLTSASTEAAHRPPDVGQLAILPGRNFRSYIHWVPNRRDWDEVRPP